MEFSREEKTYPPRTMNEIEWDDTQHRFAGAEAEDGYELVMLERRWVEGYPDLYVILCVDLEGSVGTWIPGHITPTGRKYRLEPDEGVPEGEPVQTVFDPDYIYTDRDGDEWVDADELREIADEMANWLLPLDITVQEERQRLVDLLDHFTDRIHNLLADSSPRTDHGPYTRIEEEQ